MFSKSECIVIFVLSEQIKLLEICDIYMMQKPIHCLFLLYF